MTDRVPDVKVEFNNIDLEGSNWTINGFDVVIKDANLSESHIHVTKPLQQKHQKMVNISNSTFLHVNISTGYQIEISQCVINGTSKMKTALIDIMNCDLTMVNCTFFNIIATKSGPAILKAVDSQIKMSGIGCYENDASNGLIRIQNNSQLYLEGSVFENNANDLLFFSSAILSVKNNATIHISHCTF